MSRIISIRLPQEMITELENRAMAWDMKPSQVARDLIRRGLGAVDNDYGAGFAEGRTEAHQRVMRAIHKALAEVDES